MNSNCDTFIKQEFLNADEQPINGTPDSASTILVKNEPILDEPFTLGTIKNEPHLESNSLPETVSIKTEYQETVCLETPKTLKETSSELSFRTPSLGGMNNATQVTKNTLQSTETILISNLNETSLTNKHTVDGIAAGSPPILLNAKLRKRNKVILATNSIDKRKRYFIEGTSPPSLEKSNTAPASSIEASKISRLLNPGKKKIINHLIKQKQTPNELEENSDLSQPAANVGNDKNQNAVQCVIANSMEQSKQQARLTRQTEPDTLAPLPTTILPLSVTPASKQLVDSPILPELRVKCLCSLTGDITSDNSELKKFFEEMFMETKSLNKMQQRKVKMSLLKAICDAEAAVEQGKCCSF